MISNANCDYNNTQIMHNMIKQNNKNIEYEKFFIRLFHYLCL